MTYSFPLAMTKIPVVPVGSIKYCDVQKWIDMHYEAIYLNFLNFTETTDEGEGLGFDAYATTEYLLNRVNYEPTLN